MAGTPGPELFAAVRQALSGDGPAILPLPAGSDARRAAPHPRRRRTAARAASGVPAEVAVVIATSGSTGAPRACSSPPTRCAPPRRPRCAAWTPPGRALAVLPAPLPRLRPAGAGPVAAGRDRADRARRFSPEAVLASGADHVSLVPTQLRRLLSYADLSVFRTILLGGAAAPADLLAAARAAGARVVTTYGMSETCGGCVYDGGPLTGWISPSATTAGSASPAPCCSPATGSAPTSPGRPRRRLVPHLRPRRPGRRAAARAGPGRRRHQHRRREGRRRGRGRRPGRASRDRRRRRGRPPRSRVGRAGGGRRGPALPASPPGRAPRLRQGAAARLRGPRRTGLPARNTAFAQWQAGPRGPPLWS